MKKLLITLLFSSFAAFAATPIRVTDYHAAIAAVCPIAGVDSNGNYTPIVTATPEQIAAAQAVASSYDQSAINAARQSQITALQGSYQLAIDNINASYPTAAITAADTLTAVSAKMLTAGVSLADVGAFGGQLKLIHEAITTLQQQLGE